MTPRAWQTEPKPEAATRIGNARETQAVAAQGSSHSDVRSGVHHVPRERIVRIAASVDIPIKKTGRAGGIITTHIGAELLIAKRKEQSRKQSKIKTQRNRKTFHCLFLLLRVRHLKLHQGARRLSVTSDIDYDRYPVQSGLFAALVRE